MYSLRWPGKSGPPAVFLLVHRRNMQAPRTFHPCQLSIANYQSLGLPALHHSPAGYVVPLQSAPTICLYESRLGTSLSARRTNAGLCTPLIVHKRYGHSPPVHIPTSFARLTQKPSGEKPCPAANQMREQHPANLALLLISSPTPIRSTSCLRSQKIGNAVKGHASEQFPSM